MIHTGIDYLQYSIDFNKVEISEYAENITPMRMYKRGWKNPTGERVYIGNNRSKKALVVASGETLFDIEKYIDLREHVDRILSDGGTISRIDWQVTQFVTDDLIQIVDYINYKRMGWITAKENWIKTAKVISSVTDDNLQQETLYFGDMKKRGKDGIVRVYDKGIDLGTYANAIIRLEIEEKRKTAHNSAKRFASGSDVRGIIKSRFDVSCKRWQAMMQSEEVDISRGRGINKTDEEKALKNSNSWEWMVNTIAPSLGKLVAYDAIEGKSANIELFNEEVTKAYRAHIRKLTKDIEIE